MNAWIKFSAARFCSCVPDIIAIWSPREDLESIISTDAPDICKRIDDFKKVTNHIKVVARYQDLHCK